MTVPRVVFDCVVFLQGAANESGPAGACLRLARERVVELCLSLSILGEVSDVLNRAKTRQRFKTLTDQGVQAFLEEVQAHALLVDPVQKHFSYARDPDDEPYIDLALTAGAPYLVTWDKDVLDLMNEATAEGKDFKSRFPGLTILNPVDFLRQFRSQEPRGPSGT
jgi:putative PIN family toxin of toxin-antitoxin system